MQVTGWKCVRGVFGVALVIAIDANPLHLAAEKNLFLAHDGNVVFALAGDDAGVAADAGIEVDAQRPLVAFVLKLGIEGRQRLFWRRRGGRRSG